MLEREISLAVIRKNISLWLETRTALEDFKEAPSTTGGLVQDEGRVELAQDGR
jgi:hypothetical protein